MSPRSFLPIHAVSMRLVAACAALAITLGCGGAAGPLEPEPVATTTVNILSKTFDPPSIKVAAGATVTFNNQDTFNHNITFADTTITSVANFAASTRTAVMPTTPGTYTYTCTRHSGMIGTIRVE